MEKILKYHMLTHFFLRFQLLDRLNLKKIFFYGGGPRKKNRLGGKFEKSENFRNNPRFDHLNIFQNHQKHPFFKKKTPIEGVGLNFRGRGGARFLRKFTYLLIP